jgi:hypothetical protein
MPRNFATTYVQSGDVVSGTTNETFPSTAFAVSPSGPGGYSAGTRGSENGRSFHVVIRGCYTSAASSPGTLTMKMYWTANTTNVQLGTTGAITLPTSASNWYWEIEGRVTIAKGANGTAAIIGFVGKLTLQGASNAPLIYPMNVNSGTGTAWFVTGSSGCQTNGFTNYYIRPSFQFSSSTTNALTMQSFEVTPEGVS